MTHMVGLVDCNSFFAECERVFRPDLQGKPILVLSNNDGCIVAQSKEAKDAGIPRGAPLHEVQHLLKPLDVTVFSSNYALYRNFSDRVMSILKELTTSVEPYSIDEAFFDAGLDNDPKIFEDLHTKLTTWTGLPMSLGIARTKTLAKLANYHAKRNQFSCFRLHPDEEETFLRKVPVGEVWGIGWRRIRDIERNGIKTAWDYATRDEAWIYRHYSTGGVQTWRELRGIPSVSQRSIRNQSFCSGITFSHIRSTLEELEETLSCHCMALAEKLTSHALVAEMVTIQIFTSRFTNEEYSFHTSIKLDTPTAYPPQLFKAAKKALQSIWKPQMKYKGSRIWVTQLSAAGCRQKNLFDSWEVQERIAHEDKFTRELARMQKRHGLHSLQCASSGMQTKFDLVKRQALSPAYVHAWDQIPTTDS